MKFRLIYAIVRAIVLVLAYEIAVYITRWTDTDAETI